MKTVTGLPSDSENANGWTSFRFYDYVNVINEETHKTEQKVVESDYAWYKDFKYKDTMYRATFWKKYRSNSAFTPTDSIISYSDNNVYYSENVYYFKYKPVVWRKLEKKENGYTYLVSSKIIDYEDYEPRTLDLFDLEGPKPNNYAASKIRRWLNEDFFKTAFSESLDVTNQWCCENTNDYVTLLSSKEFSKQEYNLLDKDRRNLKVTDYATSLTYSKGATCYWLRTPANENVDGNGMGLRSLVANYGDKAIGDDPTYYCYYGVVPAISVKL